MAQHHCPFLLAMTYQGGHNALVVHSHHQSKILQFNAAVKSIAGSCIPYTLAATVSQDIVT